MDLPFVGCSDSKLGRGSALRSAIVFSSHWTLIIMKVLSEDGVWLATEPSSALHIAETFSYEASCVLTPVHPGIAVQHRSRVPRHHGPGGHNMLLGTM